MPYEQPNLHKQQRRTKQRDDGQVTSVRRQGLRLISEPLRFVGSFLSTPLFRPLALFLRPSLGRLAGGNFYRSGMIGSALIGCGWSVWVSGLGLYGC